MTARGGARMRLADVGAGARTARRRSQALRTSAAVAAVAVMAAGYAGWTVRGSAREMDRARDPATLCPERHPAPEATLMALDVTDRLAAGSARRFKSLVREFGGRLPRDGRFVIVPFDGDLSRSPTAEFDLCSPGRGTEADEMWEGRDSVEREYRSRFDDPLDAVARRLLSAGPGPASPIAGQVERIIGDPAIQWRGARRRLVLFTDGLEFTAQSRVYSTGHISLPTPRADLLKDVDVDFVELVNPIRPELQTAEMRRGWERWFRLAGARSVRMYAPGYPAATLSALVSR